MLLFLEMVLFLFGNDFIYFENVLIGCTLASEYPHFKSSPINFAFQLANDLLPYCKHSYCKAEILTFRS